MLSVVWPLMKIRLETFESSRGSSSLKLGGVLSMFTKDE